MYTKKQVLTLLKELNNDKFIKWCEKNDALVEQVHTKDDAKELYNIFLEDYLKLYN